MTADILWLDLGDLDVFHARSGPQEKWQDHGLGLLRTIMHREGIATDVASLRLLARWEDLDAVVAGYSMLIMNVRSYTFPFAVRAARTFKRVNPRGTVLVGGMHATVATDEMAAIPEFDRICKGGGERSIVELARDPGAFERVFEGRGAQSLSEWPAIDRTLWPDPGRRDYPWPLEPECGWGPGPVATIMTSRVCPWRCAFCNEASYVPNAVRRPVEQVIDELNHLDRTFGPLGSVVIHDSMFFQQPAWLEEWLDKYPRLARRPWPYWAAARSDTVRQWPELFEALVRKTNWRTVSIGFESGSDSVLRILNKVCTAEDNDFAIDLLNRIGDDMARTGRAAPFFWANIILAVPGETREDAFATIRMLSRMRRVQPSVAYYAPYPGSALGYQLIAEGKSLMRKDNYHRFAGDRKVAGIDYDFYDRLLRGEFAEEVRRGAAAASPGRRTVRIELVKA